MGLEAGSKISEHHLHLNGFFDCLSEEQERALVTKCVSAIRLNLSGMPLTRAAMKAFIQSHAIQSGVTICPRKTIEIAGRLLQSRSYAHV